MTADTTNHGAVAAVDLGATSGRVMIGRVTGGYVELEPVSRFPNGPVAGLDGLRWDFAALYDHIVAGLAEALRREPAIASIGIDSWAVDYGLVRAGELDGQPFHYRDERTARGVEAVHARVPLPELYRRNGLQFLPFNTLYQLAADTRLHGADTALLIPDLVAFLLTGARVAERTNASTTGLVDVATGEWDAELIERLGIPRTLLPAIVSPGETIGAVTGRAAASIAAALPVIAVGSHDTASAVAAVPMADARTAAYISCGTWGLVGVELDEPAVSDAARKANFTNEGGVDGRVRFLHNVAGLWLLSECVREWEAQDGAPIGLVTLLDAAAAVMEPVPIFDANATELAAPGDMPRKIAAVVASAGQAAPDSRPEFVRMIVESLAEAFADALRTAATLTKRDLSVVHIVGGGSLNRLLCQATADRSGLPVLAGPVEATALGNVLVQARAHGWFGEDASLQDLRSIVAASVEIHRFEPSPRDR